MIRKQPSPRTRQSAKGREKVPLTYYRSAGSPTKGESSPFTRTKPKTKFKKFLIGALDSVVLLLFFIFFVYSLIIKPEPKISANSFSYHPQITYQKAAQEQLNSFSSRNKLTIDEDQILKNMKLKFPEIADGRLELPIFSQIPTIHLTIAEPALVLKNNTSSYIVNSIGTVVGEADKFKSNQELPIVEDQADFDLEPGSQALSVQSTSFITDVWRITKASNINIASMVLPELPMELNLKAADKPYFVKFFLGGDAALQSGQFIAARRQFEKDGINPSEYLDVRVQGKIFYK